MNTAVVRTSTGKVVTVLRSDLPAGWSPPSGCHVVPETDLPAGCEYEPQEYPVPNAVSAAQLRLWLLKHALLDQVGAAIEALPAQVRAEYKIMWEYETTFERANPKMLAIADAIGMGDDAIDQAFREAALL